MDPQQLLKTSKVFYRCKKCDFEKGFSGVGTTPLCSPKINRPTVAYMYLLTFQFLPSIHLSMGSAPVGVQCPLTSSLGEFLGYWAAWLWYPGLPPVLVSSGVNLV